MTAYPPYQAYPAQAPTMLEPPPILVAVAPPQPQQRLRVGFRLVLAVPHLIVLGVLACVAVVVGFLGWWGALFTGRLPQFAVNYLSGVVRWTARVNGYVLLLTEQYPPFSLDDDPEYLVRVAIPAPQELNRAAVFFRFILAFPAGILSALLGYGASTVVAFIAWLITLFTGRLPAPLHLAYSAVIRFQARYLGYLFMLTPAYPGKLYGDRPDAVTWADGQDAAQAAGYGAPAPGYGAPFDAPPAGYGAGYGGPGGPGYGTPAGPGYGGPGGPGYGAPAGPGYGAPAGPGYGAPAGPGYGTPAGPGYGGPGYGAPVAPGYGGPGYGAPGGFGVSGGYGAPGAYGAPAGYQPGPLSQVGIWRITLTSAAKRLLTTFIVVGAILYAIVIALDGITTDSAVTTFTGLIRLNSSYETLTGKIDTWQTATTNCGQNLTCITGQDATLAAAFSTFSGQLSSISLPSSANTAKAKLGADTKVLIADFTKLSQATDADTYNATLDSLNINEAINTWSADVSALDAAD